MITRNAIPPVRIPFGVKVLVVFIAMLLIKSQLFAQVITNTGAYVKTMSGTFVVSHELENSSGTFRNEGTLNLSNELRNWGTIMGDGAYNLKGDWRDNGVFDPGTSHVTFDGIVNQTIYHNASGERFYNLTLNSAGHTFTQISAAGGTLNVLNDLNLLAGTLNLDGTTLQLNVGGTGNIAGNLIYNGFTTQTASITGNLQGAGTIDMRTGLRPHVLNLAGATNSIGSFLTSSGASIVNYNGTNQTVFPAMNYRNLIISNSGIKVLQGNSNVGIDMTISGGTLDLGTVATTFKVDGNTSVTGGLSFDGTTTKIVDFKGNLSGSGSIDMSGGNLAHVLNLDGASNSIGAYSSGNSSTVYYTKNADQTVFPGNDYRNLTISGSGMKTMLGDVNTKGTLTMSSGSINTNSFIIELSNPVVSALVWTNGTIIGRFKRAVASIAAEYLYPIGSTTTHNPFKIIFASLNAGSLTAQFKQEDIGTAGLPLDDDGNEIHDRYTNGYWSLSSSSASLSNNFSIKLDYDGFLGVDASASIIKRTNNGNLQLDGTHGGLTADEISRNVLVNGISTTSTDFAIGKGRPKIVDQPEDSYICETIGPFYSTTYFEVNARGRGTLTYRWEVNKNDGSGFTLVSNGGVYSNATTDRLDISGAPYSMNGYLYRCIITDAQGNSNTTDIVVLTVNQIPVATATTPAPECPGIAFQDILLGTSNSVTGTTFAWSRTNPAGIETTMPLNGSAINDKITGVFNNTADAPIQITFTITPTGPATTYCVGSPITVSFWVNPTPRVFTIPANITQCDNTATDIRLTSPSTFTSGVVSFRYTVTVTEGADITGFTSPTLGLSDEHHITDVLVNHTNTYHTVIYRVVPLSPVGCVDGMPVNAQVTVNPTPKAEPLNNVPAICYGGTTQIVLTTPTTMTSGNVVFNFTVAADPGVTGNTSSESNRSPGYTIMRNYNNDSPGLQSVYYTITPVNNSLTCVPGPDVVSEVEVHARPIQAIDVTKPLTCDGGAGLGALRAVLSTGADPYHIVWSGPDFYHAVDLVDIINLSSGQYDAVVTDNLGCVYSKTSYLVPVYAEPFVYASPISPGGYNISCIGSTDGRITIAVTGGITPPYNYYFVKNDVDTLDRGIFTGNYDPGIITTYKVFNGLSAGSYTLVIVDKNSCIRLKRINMKVPPPMTVTFGKQIYPGGYNVSCTSYSDGAAWVQAIDGGRKFYKYNWSTTDGTIPGPTNTNRIDNISAGRYKLHVTDTLNCPADFYVDITEPAGMHLDNAVLSKSHDNSFNVSCNGGNDGSINVSVTGGSGMYQYSWTGPGGFTATTEDISGLKAGDYTCVIADVNGCNLFPPTFTLTEPQPLAVAYTKSVSNDGNYSINCNGGTGSVNISVTGGSAGNYTYAWSTVDGSGINPGQPVQTALKAGTYHVEVTDLNGCITSKDITMTEPPAVGLQFKVSHITCETPGFRNGAIDLTPTGGAGVLSYLWSNGAVSQDVSGLTAGTYMVTVTYNNTCSKSDSATVNLPPPLTYSSSYSNFRSYEISCYGRSDGEIHITPESGKSPFSYSWAGPGGYTSSSPDITGLKAGIYNLNITDSNKCSVTESITLREPGHLEARFVLSQSLTGGYNLNCAGDSTGTITVNPQNSVNSVRYLWSDGFNGRTRSNLKAGSYSVIITDDNNCQAQATATLTQPDSIKLSYEIKQPFCPDKPDGEIRLTVTGGVPASDYTYKWSDNSTGRSLSNISMGLYSIRVEDLNRCVVKDSIMLDSQNEACLIVPNMMTPNGDLINDYWNIGMKELYPQMEVRIYNRWGELVWKSAKGYPDPWDGRSNGTLLPIDSYHYVIDLHNGSKPVIGNVTIVK